MAATSQQLYPDLTPFYRDPESNCDVTQQGTPSARGGGHTSKKETKTNFLQVIKTKLSEINKFAKGQKADDMGEKLLQRTSDNDVIVSSSKVNDSLLPRKIPSAPPAGMNENHQAAIPAPILEIARDFQMSLPETYTAYGATSTEFMYPILKTDDMHKSSHEQGQNFSDPVTALGKTNPATHSGVMLSTEATHRGLHPTARLITYADFKALTLHETKTPEDASSTETCLPPQSGAMPVPTQQNREDTRAPSNDKAKSASKLSKDVTAVFENDDYQNWVKWRRKMNAHLSTVILLNPDSDHEVQLRRQRFSEQPSQSSVTALHHRATDHQETQLGERTYYMFGIPRVNCVKSVV